MTLIIGIKTGAGVLLAADCLIKSAETRNRHKINIFGIHRSKEGNLSGMYIGMSGYYYMADTAAVLCSSYLAKGPNRADLLTDPELNERNPEYFQELKARAEDELSKIDDEQTARLIEKKIERLTNQFELSMLLLDSKTPTPISYLSRLALRLSDNYEPDIMAIDGKITRVETVVAIGRGAKMVESCLAQGYSPDLSLEQATVLVSTAMNIVLSDTDNFCGYQLVRASKENQRNRVETASDKHARTMPYAFEQFRDYRFQ